MKKRLIEDRIYSLFKDYVEQNPNSGLNTEEDHAELAVTLNKAAHFYNPVDPEIMVYPAERVNFEGFINLLKINPEYIATKFARKHIRNLRIKLYSRIEKDRNNAKDQLEKISRLLYAKSKDHYPKKVISTHYYNIKMCLEQFWDTFSRMEQLSYFIRENFMVDIEEDFKSEKNDSVLETPSYWAKYTIEKFYGLSQETAQKYISNPLEEHLEKLIQYNLIEMTKDIS